MSDFWGSNPSNACNVILLKMKHFIWYVTCCLEEFNTLSGGSLDNQMHKILLRVGDWVAGNVRHDKYPMAVLHVVMEVRAVHRFVI